MNLNSITMLLKSHLQKAHSNILCKQKWVATFKNRPLEKNYWNSLNTNTSMKLYATEKPFLHLYTTISRGHRLYSFQWASLVNVNNSRGSLIARFSQLRNQANFHTSNPRKAVPPVIIVILRPILKLFAMLLGRSLKKWWAKLTPAEKKAVIMNFSKKYAKYAGFSAVVSCGLGSTYYVTHLKEDPLTGRKRFIMFSENQIEQLANLERDQLVNAYGNEIVPITHPYYKRVVRVAHRLILANKDIIEVRKHEWEVTVVKSDEVNAFVLPNGSIFIFSGMLDLCLNDDQLGIVLGHEMSHCLLKHVTELLSQMHVLDLLLLIPIVFIWALLPSTLAALAHGIAEYWQSLRFQLPFNRKLEIEADTVGLMLAAKACFDVREASAFWAQMQMHDKSLPGAPKIEEWMSTHPSHENRRAILDSKMDEAIRVRDQHQCPALPRYDPRLRLGRAKPIIAFPW
ncbi:unnamed protein product [Bemisia tabaci]|uniref:Metalloendopeptidase OMA1, mitochondrial n=1 Tax=Bemisia tabaci TaxID=7038 RepID=A0A9P0F683_BEMTA|nr:unnamed protein product [Bemisia tabaci]